jgi:Protein  of unknown function (DUF3018)
MRTIAERVKKHRAALRKAGLKPIQIWVPDTKKKSFAAQCHRQCLLLRDDPQEKEILEWIEKTADLSGWR